MTARDDHHNGSGCHHLLLARAAPEAMRLAALGAIAILAFLRLGRGLPRIPWASTDSESYLQYSPVRPHGYSLLLSGYRIVFTDLAHLPSVQLGLFVGAVLLLAVAVQRRARSFAAAVATLVVVFAATDTTSFPYVLSDPIYAAALTAGIAGFILYSDTPRTGFLLLASVGLGIAVTFRAIGLALLPGFFFAIVLDRIGRRRGLVSTVALGAFPIAVLCLAAASSQLIHNGRFVVGSWGGMDVLGKVPLLGRAVPEASGSLNRLVKAMELGRTKLRQLNPFVESLAARQYYEFLRWYVIIPELERSWPDWRDGDDYRRGQLAAELAEAYIAQNKFGFARRTAIDLAGLWAMPRWLTDRERKSALAEIEAAGELPGLTAFLRTPEAQLEYYQIVPYPSDPSQIAIFRLMVASFWVLSLGFIALVLILRVRAPAIMPDVVLILMTVHALYLGTALMEGAYERYIMPTWPALVAGPILAFWLFRRLRSETVSPGGRAPPAN
jgi:hypothetical protein